MKRLLTDITIFLLALFVSLVCTCFEFVILEDVYDIFAEYLLKAWYGRKYTGNTEAVFTMAFLLSLAAKTALFFSALSKRYQD